MKRSGTFSLLCLLCGLLLVACQRDRGVFAGNDSDTYQPRPAPKAHAQSKDSDEVKGELLRVDMGRKTISIRVENGMEQTFKFDDNTIVMGLENNPAVRSLVGKEGSEVTVQWQDSDGTKMASNIEVTQIATSNKVRRSRKR